MTVEELYSALDKIHNTWQTVEVFEGVRIIRFEVEEQDDDNRKEEPCYQ
jgi:hypothetical protein